MRYFILGLSCSLTACMNKDTTTQTSVQEELQGEQQEPQEETSHTGAEQVAKDAIDAKPQIASNDVEEAEPYNDSTNEVTALAVEQLIQELENIPIRGVMSAESASSSDLSIAFEGAEVVSAGVKTNKRAALRSKRDAGGGGSYGLGGLGTKGIGAGGAGRGASGASFGAAIGDGVDADTTYYSSNTEEYTDYGVNEFTQTKEDAHSTFSIDVDTASFTIARKKIASGSIPPISSIRTEEFINYFAYGYDAPKNDVFNIDMKAFTDPLRADHTYLRVGLKAKEYTAKTRPPLNLSFLVDVSGSMSDADKLPLAQKAMEKLVESLRPDDTISISTYAGRTALILPATKGSNKATIKRAIHAMEAGGSTAMSSGIDLAYEQVWKHFHPNTENRVVVLSDGDANVGHIDHSSLLSQIKSYADRGVTLSTIGFGMGNYKDTRMEQLANKGDGNYYYIDTEREADKVFVEGFNSTMISIARDVKIQVEFDPAVVSSYRLIGYENRDIADKDFRNDKVDAGEVGAGHSVTALYELKTTGAEGALATTRLRYEPPGKDSTATERVYQLSSSHIEQDLSKDLQLAYSAATFAEILRKSPYVHDISLKTLLQYTEQKKVSAELSKVIKEAINIETTLSSK